MIKHIKGASIWHVLSLINSHHKNNIHPYLSLTNLSLELLQFNGLLFGIILYVQNVDLLKIEFKQNIPASLLKNINVTPVH